jgi:hypothetical protein
MHKFGIKFIDIIKLMGNSVVKQEKCELFGSFGFMVQFSLGLFSFMSLLSKKI